MKKSFLWLILYHSQVLFLSYVGILISKKETISFNTYCILFLTKLYDDIFFVLKCIFDFNIINFKEGQICKYI